MIAGGDSAIERMNKTVQRECSRLGINVVTTTVPVTDRNGKPVTGPDGKPLTRKVNTMAGMTKEAYELLEFFHEATPCWFKGCEALRAQYRAERDAMDCSGCTGATMRKYMGLARKMMDADPDRVVPTSD